MQRTQAIIFIGICVFLSSCFKNLTKTNIVYFNDFETGDTNELKVSGYTNNGFTKITPPISSYNSSKVLGFFNSNLIEVNLGKLPEHYAIKVELDLYIHDVWKNDLWKLTVGSTDYLLTGFSNDPSVQQSFPNWLGNGSSLSPAGANAYLKSMPSACATAHPSLGSAQYKIVQTIQHSSDSLRLAFSDAGNYFLQTCQRSWSIDNLKITLITN